ncbi:hypothetical protein [Sulfurisoma sediminicola]|uniref:Sulfite exporter TauE/SafE n=1 Tax=Sulfurisoma sediminicola TaxID=1381557 RepID=A0A497XDK1_9PROT|nr:hypothetical protein [Sulfurisoma sediminicola]RLJ65043.1 hypothetical protein DFR35_1699 [Sulfurisoma sediminicola]
MAAPVGVLTGMVGTHVARRVHGAMLIREFAWFLVLVASYILLTSALGT